MDAAMYYELFIRSAFGLANGVRVGRLEDPAAFADTDTFSNGNLPVVKAATGYAMGVYQNNLKIRSAEVVDSCDAFIAAVVAAGDVAAVSEQINTFSEQIIEQYYDRNDGVLVPKQ